MANESVRVSAVIPATVEDIYAAWLDAERHGAFTGGQATVEPHVGGRHTAWDGYIEGEILELVAPRRIVQSWRSLDFPQDAQSSRLEVLLVSARGGTEVTLVHTDIPAGQGADYEEGWVEHYFKPMQKYFAGSKSAPSMQAAASKVKAKAAPRMKAKAVAKKPPAKTASKPKAKTASKSKAKTASKPKRAAKKKPAKAASKTTVKLAAKKRPAKVAAKTKVKAASKIRAKARPKKLPGNTSRAPKKRDARR